MSAPPTSSRQAAADVEWIRRRGLREFVRRAWPQVEPAELVWGRHLDAVCEHLEAWLRGDFDDLVINEPPGCSKSLVVSTLFAAYVWIERPTWRWIAASYDRDVANRDARRHRELVASDWWRARWPSVGIPSGSSDSKAVGYFFNTAGGSRFTTTTRGSVTGQHADGHVVDDPHDPHGVASAAELDATLAWWRETMPTRFRDPKRPRRLMVMQRLHERDLSAEMIRDGATVLCLPMRFDPAHPQRSARDWRTAPGELLVPERYPLDALERLERRLGPFATAAQLQQRPVPAGGAIFKAEWFKRWTELPPGGVWSMSIDCTFKATTDGSFVVIQVWYDIGAHHYLVDQRRERMGYADTVAAIRAMTVQYPKARTKRIEAKANGPAVIEALSGPDGVGGVVPVEPEGGKEARANAVQGIVAGGGVYLPDEQHAKYDDGRRGAPWVASFVHEATTFPKGEHDDQVDGMTQHLNAATGGYAARLKAAFAGSK